MMPLPLIWLGAACAGLYAGKKLNTYSLKQSGAVTCLPGESSLSEIPQNGDVLCCEVYQMLDHTGIWIDGGIYELNGDGLVRKISPKRFLENRSGDIIYLAPMNFSKEKQAEVAARCTNNLFSLRSYHLLSNNCHNFVSEMLIGESQGITSFSNLNETLWQWRKQPLRWVTAMLKGD